MSNKMLIDASHPEETRVAVVRGNRIEEFDFESQEKKQLRGNIYLAKVTRVEPSLQAAFVDYGGNRHGFLAFSEIHPDYYQIPVADRQALLEAEAEDARASRDAEEDEDNVVEVISEDDDDNDENEAPKKKSRRRRSRKSKSADTNTETDDSEDNETSQDNKSDNQTNSEETVTEAKPVETEVEAQTSEEEKPKRTSTRRKKAPIAKKVEEPQEAKSEEAPAIEVAEAKPEAEEKPKRRTTRRKKAPVTETSSDDDDGTPTTMAAMVEMDSISEPLPEDADEPEDNTDATDDEPVAEEKPKRRSTRRKAAPKKTAKAKEETSETAPEETASDASETETQQVEAKPNEEAPKPKKRAPRRNPRKKKEAVAEEEASETSVKDEDGSENNTDDTIESVGQEDPLEEVPVSPRRQRRHYKIQEVIKRRQVLLVQVVKEERGNKGAALTTYLSLAGRYSVLMPNTARGGGISRKITNAADRKRLKAIAVSLDVPQGMGVILRTAGASRTNAEIERDFDYLMRLWEQVRNLTLSSSAPCLVYEEGSLIKRSIRDLYDKDTGEVVVAGEDGFKEAKDFMTMLMPTASNKVKLHHDKQSIFAKFGVETQLDKMVTPQVTLKSGGYLIIDQTEALVAVDVNSGRSTREHSIENTALQTNLEAAEEVARQLRLRDLAGLIVIDFIDMEEKRNNRSVEKKLKDCLKNDRARIQVGRISHFGLMEMSRQRMRASVLESTMDVCASCGGTGHVRSDSAIALHVFRAIEEHVSRHNRYDAVVKTTPAIAMNILNHKRSSLLELENRYGLAIIIEASGEMKGQEFDIQKGEIASGEVKSTAVAYQNGSIDSENSSDDEDNSSNRGKNRNRGRHKNQDAENQSVSEEVNSETPATSNDEDDDDKPRKKRRRGKRGGRRRPGEETSEETTEQSKDETASETAGVASSSSEAETKPSETINEAPTQAVSDEASEKPKSRSTTRRKAPISKLAELATSEATTKVASPEPSEEQEESKPRRTTRRKKPEEVEASTDVDATQAQVDNTSNETSEPTDEKPDGEKKKKGWWNRGGGFF